MLDGGESWPMIKKPVLIVGGAQGIGKEIAERFLKEGHRVAVSDINEQGLSLLKNSTLILLTFQADVSSWESVQQMISAARKGARRYCSSCLFSRDDKN
ncbi:SDR family NAD(P)-dependent oxidoreductase [Bacillus sp. SL00103]